MTLQSICLSVFLSVPCLWFNDDVFYGYWYYIPLIGNTVLEIKPTGQHGCTNGNKAIARAASEAFFRWLHHLYAPSVKLPSASDISFCHTMPCCCCKQGSQHSRQVAPAVYRSALGTRSRYVYERYTTSSCSTHLRAATKSPYHCADKLSTTSRRRTDTTIRMWRPCSTFWHLFTG